MNRPLGKEDESILRSGDGVCAGVSVSPHLRCIVSDSAGSGKCWPTKTRLSQSHHLVSKRRRRTISAHRYLLTSPFHSFGTSLYLVLGYRTSTKYTHLEDLLDAVNGRREQSANFLVIVDVVCVSQAHEEDVGWQTWDQIHRYAARFQLWKVKEFQISHCINMNLI